MVAPNSGYSGQSSPAKQRKAYAGVNLPAPKRGESPTVVDESFDGNPGRIADAASYMDLIRDCALLHPGECQYLAHTLHYYVDGLSLADIAELMGVSKSTARDRINRTLNFLETFLREQEHKA